MKGKTFQVTVLYTINDPDCTTTLKSEREIWKKSEVLNDFTIKVKKFEIREVK